MMMISPSLLAADFTKLDRELDRITRGGAEWLHLDVMDGVFVPNISFGLPVIQSLRKISKLTFDVHLMIQEPLLYVDAFADAGADYLTFHLESSSDPEKMIDAIHARGMKAGLSIKPNTPAEAVFPYLDKLDLILVMSVEPGFGGQKFMPACLDKIRILHEKAPEIPISVDGGVNEETGRALTDAGADVLIAGSYIFRGGNIEDHVQALKRL